MKNSLAIVEMMRLLVCFVIVCVSSTSNLAMESNEEEFNLEKELQSLNKPPVTTVEVFPKLKIEFYNYAKKIIFILFSLIVAFYFYFRLKEVKLLIV